VNPLINLPKYSSYSDSGIEWLGELPCDWGLTSGFNAYDENKRDNKGMKEDRVLSLSYGKIVVKPKEKLVGLVPESFETYQIVEPGDLIVRCMDLQNDKTSLRFGLSEHHGIITSAYLNLKVKEGFDSKFLYYYLHSLDTTKVIYKFGTGLRQNLSFQDFRRLPVLGIPKELQADIASFLDRKTNQIDQAVAIKEKQIELLKERKQILIQNTVTRGLDSNVSMKDSGVDWIGDVPEHWDVKKIKFVTKINQYSLDENTSTDFHFGYVDIGSVSFENGVECVEYYTFGEAPSRARRLARMGDVIISTVRTYLKAIDYVSEDKASYVYSTGFAVLSPLEEFSPKYLKTFVLSNAFTNQVDDYSKGVSYPAINSTDLSNIYVCVPPLEEQLEISKDVEERLSGIGAVMENQVAQIEKLKEYKATLINSAVTGKIKVV